MLGAPNTSSKHVEFVCEIDDFDLVEFVDVAANFGSRRFGHVVTPNVDHLIRFHDDDAFRGLYADTSFVLNDSHFASHLLWATRGVELPVCTGSDLTAELLTSVAAPNERLVLIIDALLRSGPSIICAPPHP